ncbi:MAG: type III pantothenate kinase [Planctomycetota bacterium]
MMDADGGDGNEGSPWDELSPPEGTALAVCVGNTSIAVGRIEGLSIQGVTRFPADDADAVAQAAAALANALDEPPDTALLAGVHRGHARTVARALTDRGLVVVPFGPAMPVPIATEVDDAAQVGQDRLLTALGAFQRVRQACIVVDAGTAVTVDFIDGAGVFHGGAILPGAGMMLRALHQGADALPIAELADMPDPLEPFGRNTAHAMLLGVRAAIAGAVRTLAERYAEFYEAYPQIIATGGDAPTLLGDDELIEAVVPELELLGVAVARARLTAELG